MRVSVIGLGKLGSPIAAVLAAKGYEVIGVDVDERKVSRIRSGTAPVFEPFLNEYIRHAGDNLRATTDLREAVLNSSLSFIIVPTPSEPSGEFSLRYVLPVCDELHRLIKEKDEFHVVVITSTVMPGHTGGPIKETLERSTLRCGEDFGLCYNPEFIALGSVIQDFLNPDFVLIGESDPYSGETLAQIYRNVCENDPPILKTNFINAEIAKIAINTFVTTKITFANTLARICERVPDANVDEVTRILGYDHRINPHYLKGAIGYGGPCFPRDNIAFSKFAREIGVRAQIAEVTDKLNRLQVELVTDIVLEHLDPKGVVGILGLTYKPDTDVTEESQSLQLACALKEKGISVIAYDPSLLPTETEVELASTLHECVDKSDLVVLATPWKSIIDGLTPGMLRGKTLVDCWRVANFTLFKKVLKKYIPLGVFCR